MTIKKSGNYEVQSGQAMSYDFSGIARTPPMSRSTTFFWHDRIPTDATRHQHQHQYLQCAPYCKVTFKTNLSDYRTLASNLLTSNNYLPEPPLRCGLAQGEYVWMSGFEFGTVPSGFVRVGSLPCVCRCLAREQPSREAVQYLSYLRSLSTDSTDPV